MKLLIALEEIIARRQKAFADAASFWPRAYAKISRAINTTSQRCNPSLSAELSVIYAHYKVVLVDRTETFFNSYD